MSRKKNPKLPMLNMWLKNKNSTIEILQPLVGKLSIKNVVQAKNHPMS